MPASTTRVSNEEIIEAYAAWKRNPMGVTAQEVAEDLGVSKSTLYKIASQAGLVSEDPDLASTHRDHLTRIEQMLEEIMEGMGRTPPPRLDQKGLRKR